MSHSRLFAEQRDFSVPELILNNQLELSVLELAQN